MLDRLYGWYGKPVVLGALGALVLLVVIGIIIRGAADDSASEEVAKLPVVTLRAVGALESESVFSVVGTVRSVSEAQLRAEAGGRITSVPVRVGDTVTAGTVLATIENDRERASLLQAEGAYESALASARGSGVTLEEARVGAANAYQNAFTVVDGIVQSTIDDYYMNPEGPIIGYRLSSGNPTVMNARRADVEAMRIAWRTSIARGVVGDVDVLTDAESNVRLLSALITDLNDIVLDEPRTSIFFDEAYQQELIGARATLDGVLASLSAARRVLAQAEVSGASNGTSEADARVKSALGTLRAAQAAYEKTLVRTPISGVVNALNMVAGEYATLGQPAAVVANNGSLEVKTALGESDLETITIGDAVTVNGSVTGVITSIAPAIDPVSGKAEVRVSVDDADALTNGTTVTITFSRNTAEASESDMILLPLAALKLLPSGPVAFGVNDEGVLVAYPVTLGAIMGDTVEVLEGLTRESVIVTDARGLRAGDAVTVTQE